MKRLQSIIFGLALLVIIICISLLVTNYDPTHPTHRRYSSESVQTTGDSNAIGLSGEEVLSKDLNLPRNDEQIPQLAVCNSKYTEQSPPTQNTQCFYYSDDIKNYRVPDFVSDDIIAESKNAQRLLTMHKRDYQQIQEMAIASRETNRPLWLYVRHNTLVDAEYRQIVESTGGRIIYYFATPNFVAPIDSVLLITILGALGVMILVFLWEIVTRIVSFRLPTYRKPTSSVVVPEHKASRKARHTVDDYETFIRDAGYNARDILDE